MRKSKKIIAVGLLICLFVAVLIAFAGCNNTGKYYTISAESYYAYTPTSFHYISEDIRFSCCLHNVTDKELSIKLKLKFYYGTSEGAEKYLTVNGNIPKLKPGERINVYAEDVMEGTTFAVAGFDEDKMSYEIIEEKIEVIKS